MRVDKSARVENRRRVAHARLLQTTDNPHVVKCYGSFYTTVVGPDRG